MNIEIWYIFCNYLSFILFSLSTVYQTYNVVRTKHTQNIMLTTVVIRLFALGVFLPYLIYFKVYHTVYTVICQVIITSTLIILICYYRYWKRSDDVDFSHYLLPN